MRIVMIHIALAVLGAHYLTGAETVRLQLKWKHQFQFAGYYAALEQGYYADAGLEVELKEASPDMGPMEAVLAGEADYGVSTSDIIPFLINFDLIVTSGSVC